MDIVLVGSGNVATVLGRKSLAAGHRIVQVYSPDGSHANTLAIRLGTSSTSYISSIDKKADLMIIAIRDESVRPFVKDLGKVQLPVVHTAGSVSIEELKNSGDCYGVLYPLQSLRKELETMPPLSILVDGNNQKTTDLLKKLASGIAVKVTVAGDQERLKYHLAATIVNNFGNYLFTLAASFCEKENISFSVLQPLLEETVTRIRSVPPADAQTGPAIRKDLATLEKHRDLLIGHPDILIFYDLFTREIMNNL